MTSLALALALASQWPSAPAPPWYRPWRVYTSATVHIGARPGFFLDNETITGVWEIGGGATVQVTTDWLWLM